MAATYTFSVPASLYRTTIEDSVTVASPRTLHSSSAPRAQRPISSPQGPRSPHRHTLTQGPQKRQAGWGWGSGCARVPMHTRGSCSSVVKWARAFRGRRNHDGLEAGSCGDGELCAWRWSKCHLPSHRKPHEKTNMILKLTQGQRIWKGEKGKRIKAQEVFGLQNPPQGSQPPLL